MFSSKQRVRLEHTDASGVLFFPNQFLFAQSAIEDFFHSKNIELSTYLREINTGIAVVHAESNYYKPLQMGMLLTSHLTLEKLGKTSFTLSYEFFLGEGVKAGDARLIYVTLNPLREKTEIPPLLETLLKQI